MALILNIETSASACSVALAADGVPIAIKESVLENSHSSLLTVFINEIFKTAGITASALGAVAVSMGPGSYTGLRIGVSVAKGICYAASKPLIAVNTLQALANGIIMEKEKRLPGISNNTLLCPLMDARRMEVYYALFGTNGEFKKETVAEIINENSFNEILADHNVIFFGSGAEKCSKIINHPAARFIQNINPSAIYMTTLSESYFNKKKFEDVAGFEPYYLKDFVAKPPKKLF